MSTAVVAFSDLLNKPKDTLASMARSGAAVLRLRRRDAEDLALTTVSRRAQEHAVVSAAVPVVKLNVTGPATFPSTSFTPLTFTV